jgi:hypothetical protein
MEWVVGLLPAWIRVKCMVWGGLGEKKNSYELLCYDDSLEDC